MENIERVSDRKSLEALRGELTAKVGECEKFRDALITYLRGLYARDDADAEMTTDMKDFILDFEMRAIHPVNTILRSPESFSDYRDRIPEFIQTLNTWLASIESRFGIRWQDRPSAEIVYLPERPSAHGRA